MSANLPVGATVNEAFRFGMKRWQAVLRFMWLPIIFGVVVLGGVISAMVDFKAAEASGAITTFDAFKSILRVPPPIFFAGVMAAYLGLFLFVSGGAASIYRLVIHGEERPGVFQLRFDGPAIRVFLSFVILGLINFAIFGVALLIASAVTRQAPLSGMSAITDLFAAAAKAKPGETLPTEMVTRIMDEARPLISAWFYSLAPMLYFGVKLAPFPAGSAAEDRLLLFGTFRMTFGNWWSMFACYALTVVAMFLLAIVVEIPFQIVTGLGRALANQGAAAGVMGGLIVAVAALAHFVYQMFVIAVQLALNAIIYRRLAYGE